MSRAAKGADCKSAGYAFVGSSPTSPTTLFLFTNFDEKLAERLARCVSQGRALLVYVLGDRWRGPGGPLDWDKEMARAVLGEFAGMSAEELAAI